MGQLRTLLGSARAKVKVRLRRGTGVERWIYYTFWSDAYRREQSVVSRGNQEYWRRRQDGNLEFLLRRNIHMAEKGLTMRPLRQTFALAYITETVELADRLVANEQGVLSPEVESWAREVLERYFEATSASDHKVIVDARRLFAHVRWNVERDNVSGPHAPFVTPSPVHVDDLLELARQRKSVRWFEQRQVDRGLVDHAMRVAAEAPSACNRQPFTFRIFDDPDLIEQVAAIPMGTAGYGHNLPGIAVIVGDLSAFIDERDRHLIYTDGCLAAMSFILALEAQGVASVCINWPDIAKRDARMSKLLGLGDHERVVMLVGYGFADGTGLTPFSAKRSLDALRSYNTL